MVVDLTKSSSAITVPPAIQQSAVSVIYPSTLFARKDVISSTLTVTGQIKRAWVYTAHFTSPMPPLPFRT